MDVDYAPEEEHEVPSAPKPPTGDFFVPRPDPLSADVFTPLIPPLAICAAAFCLVGLVIWAGQRMTHAADHNAYTQAISSEMAAVSPADPGALYRTAGPFGGLRRVSPPLPPPRPLSISLITGPFLGDEKRAEARRAITPAHDMLTLIRKFDGPLLWGTDSYGRSGRGSGTVATAPMAFPPAGSSPAGDVTRAATFQSRSDAGMANVRDTEVAVERVHARTESLSTQVDLYVFPGQVPEPLQPGVRSVAQELHSFLKDADLASTADPADRATLRDRASRRLTHADRVLQYMDGVINGTTDPNVVPQP